MHFGIAADTVRWVSHKWLMYSTARCSGVYCIRFWGPRTCNLSNWLPTSHAIIIVHRYDFAVDKINMRLPSHARYDTFTFDCIISEGRMWRQKYCIAALARYPNNLTIVQSQCTRSPYRALGPGPPMHFTGSRKWNSIIQIDSYLSPSSSVSY